MKHSSLFVKLVLLFLLASLSMFILLNTVGVQNMRKTMLENKREELYTEANLLVTDYLAEYYERNLGFYELLERLEVVGKATGTRIWMVSTNGVVILDTEGTANGYCVTDVQEDFLEQTFVESFYMKGATAEPYLCTNVPILYDYKKKGFLVVSAPMTKIYEMSTVYVDFVNICYLIFLPLLLLVFARVYTFTALPLTKMTEGAKRFSRSNFKEPLELNYPQEYRELGNTIQYMGDKLRNSDDFQRKFISNVSHDFRSPLTSIKGYVEAIKDGTIPPEMQEKYLDIVIYETDRLTKLTSNLLELNTFDDTGVILHKSEFDINAMIKQIALTFEGTFKKKKLVLNLIFGQREQLVEGDPDKIQQVLYNLIDNAIKFSNVDSKIRIATEEKGTKVFVSVKDYGIGIPKDSLDKIWERFYKTDLSRGKDKKGTGLGLSIVKEIITAHEENISVVSTEGVGTEFTFTLPRVE